MEHLRKLKSWEAAILGCSQATEEPLTEAASTPRYAGRSLRNTLDRLDQCPAPRPGPRLQTQGGSLVTSPNLRFDIYDPKTLQRWTKRSPPFGIC